MTDLLRTWGSLIVAVVALAQPWAFAFYRRFFRPGQVDIYETGNIEIGFSGFGPTIGLYGTLRALNRESFARSIDLRLVRLKDRAEHRFSWALLRSEKLSSTSGRDMTFQFCSTRPDQTHSKLREFELTKAHVEALRLNVVKILQDACGQVFGVYNFAYPKYVEPQSL